MTVVDAVPTDTTELAGNVRTTAVGVGVGVFVGVGVSVACPKHETAISATAAITNMILIQAPPNIRGGFDAAPVRSLVHIAPCSDYRYLNPVDRVDCHKGNRAASRRAPDRIASA